MANKSSAITPSTPVRLRGTNARYVVEALYCTNALAPAWSEQWARLTTTDGRPAFWLVSQLEEV